MKAFAKAAGVVLVASNLAACATIETPGTRGSGAFVTGTGNDCTVGAGVNLGLVGVSGRSFSQKCADQRAAREAINRPEKTSAAIGVAVMSQYSDKFKNASDAVHDAASRKPQTLDDCKIVTVDAKANKFKAVCKDPAFIMAN